MQTFNFTASSRKIERTHQFEGTILDVETNIVGGEKNLTQYKFKVKVLDQVVTTTCIKGSITGQTNPQFMIGAKGTFKGIVVPWTNPDNPDDVRDTFNCKEMSYVPTKLSQLGMSGVSINATADLFS